MEIFLTIKLPILMILFIGLLSFLHWMFDNVFRYNFDMDEKISRLIGEETYNKICESMLNICFVLCLIFVVYITVEIISLVLLI